MNLKDSRTPRENSAYRRSSERPKSPSGCAGLAVIGFLGFLALQATVCYASDGPSRLIASFQNPEAVERVGNGELDVANAAWWGFDPLDATDAIQGAIDSGAAKVVIPYVGRDWIVRPLTLASNQDILLEPGVVITAKKGAFRGKHDSLFEGTEVSNVTLRGYGAVLRMRKQDYMSPEYVKSEFRHAMALKGVQRITLLGLTLEGSGGDGIYLGPTWDERRIPCRNVRIRDCLCDDNYRQGISVVSAEHLRIENCTISNTRGTSPQAAVDLEPSNFRDRLVDVELRDCIAESNEGTGFSVHLGRLTAKSHDVSVRIVDCLTRGSRHPGLRAMLNLKSAPGGFVEFKNCVTENIIHSGVWVQWNTSAPIQLRFIDCKWKDVARTSRAKPIALELTSREQAPRGGGIEFVNCYVYDNMKRRSLRVVDLEKGDRDDHVAGEIHFINPTGRIDPLAIKWLPHLKMIHHKQRR